MISSLRQKTRILEKNTKAGKLYKEASFKRKTASATKGSKSGKRGR